jgi:hypothetical protein
VTAICRDMSRVESVKVSGRSEKWFVKLGIIVCFQNK